MTTPGLLTSILSFVVGAVFGGAGVYAFLKPRLTPREPAMASDARDHEPGAWTARLFGLAVILCSLVSVGISVAAQRELAHVTACQTDYNERFAQALTARQVITEEDRAALDELVIRVTSATSREESRDALQDYIDRRRRADKARAQNPLPDPLSGHCADGRPS